MTRTTLAVLILALWGTGICNAEYASDFRAFSIEVSKKPAELWVQKPEIFGLGCYSGLVQRLHNVDKIQLGDGLSWGRNRINVGMIKVTKFNADVLLDGKTIARRGDVICQIAEAETELPTFGECSARWVQVNSCKVIEELTDH